MLVGVSGFLSGINMHKYFSVFLGGGGFPEWSHQAASDICAGKAQSDCRIRCCRHNFSRLSRLFSRSKSCSAVNVNARALWLVDRLCITLDRVRSDGGVLCGHNIQESTELHQTCRLISIWFQLNSFLSYLARNKNPKTQKPAKIHFTLEPKRLCAPFITMYTGL